jgi:hypothetical protein
VGRPVNGRTVLTVAFSTASNIRPAWLVHVTIQDGRVVRIEKDQSNPLTCALMPDRAMTCDVPAERKSHYYPPT